MSIENKNYLAISSAAGLLHIHPETLRRYEAKGLIKSEKTAGGHRRYLESDIQTLKLEIEQGCLKTDKFCNKGADSEGLVENGQAKQKAKSNRGGSFQDAWLKETIASINTDDINIDQGSTLQQREQLNAGNLSRIERCNNWAYRHQTILLIVVSGLAVLAVLTALAALFLETGSLIIFFAMICAIAGSLIVPPLLATLIFGYLVALAVPIVYYTYLEASSSESLLAGACFVAITIIIGFSGFVYTYIEDLVEYK